MNEKAYIQSIVLAVRNDLSKGLKKDEVLKNLSRVISSDLFSKVKAQL
ncbi:MAG TPA: hypothetical protein PLM53_01295 [Spirochaetota bacterium]|nr:hypothetical protein [Spirochaetota bacterium]HPC41988.1 hypothetical protein [Spirochaetota bacterium]HPL17248.1 hypothetical protein [Spirochaetota bacterium]HQF06966.1 hypothetical protein [Spirochaetota bacterium]HQH95703.1 hypothetical protein [Spirochaetota bacterium]